MVKKGSRHKEEVFILDAIQLWPRKRNHVSVYTACPVVECPLVGIKSRQFSHHTKKYNNVFVFLDLKQAKAVRDWLTQYIKGVERA